VRLLLTVLANPLLFGSISTDQLTPVVAELLGSYRASMLGADKLGAFAMTEYTATRQNTQMNIRKSLKLKPQNSYSTFELTTLVSVKVFSHFCEACVTLFKLSRCEDI